MAKAKQGNARQGKRSFGKKHQKKSVKWEYNSDSSEDEVAKEAPVKEAKPIEEKKVVIEEKQIEPDHDDSDAGIDHEAVDNDEGRIASPTEA